MAGKKFSIGDYIGTSAGVSELDREVITRIPLDLIDPDPCNFYSLEGLDQLAGNIELVGLLDPLRVRPAGTAGADSQISPKEGGPMRASAPTGKTPRYVVVSGHRRRAALKLIRDGGGELFRPGGRYADGVPCIVEYGEASDAMRELRLIFANSATRVMSAAEISRQAERVTELLYELSKQGVEFPGRMRDHVAEACRVSSTKLARLHAIRERLVPELLARFDKGEINESVAYRISQEDETMQARILKDQGEVLEYLTADGIGSFVAQVRYLDSTQATCCEEPDDAVGADIIRPQARDEDGGPKWASVPTDEDDDEGGDDDEGPAVSILDLVPRWQTGTPARAGRYLCRLDLGLNKLTEQRCDFRDGAWTAYGRPVSDVGEVVDWWPLPEEG